MLYKSIFNKIFLFIVPLGLEYIHLHLLSCMRMFQKPKKEKQEEQREENQAQCHKPVVLAHRRPKQALSMGLRPARAMQQVFVSNKMNKKEEEEEKGGREEEEQGEERAWR